MTYYKQSEKQFEKLKEKNSVKILAIESSCDETSIAVVENGRRLLSNIVASQIDIHKRFGGVVPEVASRNHILAINNVLELSLKEAGLTLEDIDAIAVTYGGGLIGALLVGVNFAKALAYTLNKPLLAVNHIHGHIAANYLTYPQLTPPFTCLVASGGHTAILNVSTFVNFDLIGTTTDDAAGEAFDKVARVLGLGYPGGPQIDKVAKLGKADIVFKTKSSLKNSFNFSFSGIKTAVINYLNTQKQKEKPVNIHDVAASFQSLVVDELVEKTIKAALMLGHKKIVCAGGVAANSLLGSKMKTQCEKNGLEVYLPQLSLCTDNAAMIGSMAYFNLKAGLGLSGLDLSAKSHLPLKTI